MTEAAFPVAKLATLMFMMMGPIGLIPTFAAATGRADRALQRQIALRAFGFSVIALLVAILIGAGVLIAWGASRPALIVAAGLLLALSSLRHILGFGGPHGPAGEPAPPGKELALSPIAFPTIVSPHGVGVLIVFVAYAPTGDVKLAILGVAIAILVLDLFAMWFAHPIMKWMGRVPLTILGAVFGVLQVALGIEIIASGITLRMTGGG